MTPGFMDTYKAAVFGYFLFVFVLFLPFLAGDVVAPHRQAAEVGLTHETYEDARRENRKFSDYTSAYIPEIQEHIMAPRSGWVALWTKQSELGRPLYQISGFSPVYLPSWVIFQITEDPRRMVTILSLSNTVLAGFFMMLFAREVSLRPIAGWAAGVTLAASPVFMYWLTFPMFSAVWCWAAGALWATTRLAQKPEALTWSVLAFSCYSLLMTAYPQPVVFHGYILFIYAIFMTSRQKTLVSASVFLVLLLLAVMVAVALAAPVYIDLLKVASESARLKPDASFFTQVLPQMSNLSDAVQFMALSTVPELFGNPVSSQFPWPYNGLSLTPLALFFVVICGLTAFRKTWGWWLAIAVMLLFAFMHPLYVFGVHYLGFNLSRSTPFGSMILPLTILLAFGLDVIARTSHRAARRRLAWIAGICGLVALALGIALGVLTETNIRWKALPVFLLLTGMLFLYAVTLRPVFLIAAVVVSLVAQSYPLMLRQDPARIATASALTEKVRRHLPDGSRFAIVSSDIHVFPPNLTAGLGLASIHTYNSLSSRRYHALIERLGGEMQTYGRRNTAISPDYGSLDFWMSNIGLVLAPAEISHPNLEPLGSEVGVHLHRVKARMHTGMQVFHTSPDPGVPQIGLVDFRAAQRHKPVTVSLDQGDLLEFRIASARKSMLVLSQRFHSDWKGFARVDQNWQPVGTVEVNGVYQGVDIPKGATHIRLSFEPFTRHAWVSNVFWGALLSALMVAQLIKKRKAGLKST
ncbi:hypothetical protein KX928_23780 [Roseobacter sp. YSTF-M11]|uniref:Bacterial membrane protein YfhO n=1 Tax=Roseobacter insulae TaxID=2859783 RepID=A0A9X1G071_9RHOB|nr:hypothetical protein [Roseobacter insulae]MBW4710823.1 hypothetical protein [Roseobacter insulae]